MHNDHVLSGLSGRVPFSMNGRFALVDTSQSRLLLVVINRSLVVHICMSGLVDCSDNVRLCMSAGMDAHLV